MNLVIESEVDPIEYQSIFFDRPISNLRKKDVAILVGRHTNLFSVQQVFEIILGLGHNPVLICDDKLREHGLPADIYLANNNQLVYENTDQAIERIFDSHLLIAGIGLELNASMQLLLERIINQVKSSVVLTDSAVKLPGIADNINNRQLLACSTKALLAIDKHSRKINSAGLLRKIEIIIGLVNGTKANVLCMEDHQLLALDITSQKSGVINSQQSIEPMAYLAILVSLLADRDQPFGPGWYEYALAAGYLYKTVYMNKKTPSALQEFLQDQI